MVTPVNISHVFNGDLSAADLVDAASLDTQLGNLASTVNAEIAERQRTIRDGSGLASQVVRFPSLHPEITALLTAGGLIPLQAAAALAVSNVATLTGLQTIDGYVLLANDRVLLVGQSNTINNGLWIASAGAWTRPSDSANNATLAAYTFVNILNGTTQTGSTWYLSAESTVSLTAQNWVVYSGFGTVVPIARGGTGATTAPQALTNLGVSAYGQTLGNDADAATARVTLGGVTISVDTVAAMTALVGNDRVGTIIVRGYTTKGDGGGGPFYWDSASTATADGAFVFNSDAGGVGRFIRAASASFAPSKWCGIVADGTTDQTSEILAVLVGGIERLMIEENTLYDRPALLADATFPTSAVLLDMSVINDFRSAGETTKHIGIVSKDEAVSDTHFAIDSAHHSIVSLNNYGRAGSTSAAERKSSIIWNVGQFALAAANKRGFRGAAIKQFTKITGADFWVETLRSLAPWASIDGEYESWTTGEVIAGAGVYRTASSQQYVSTGAGTTGATEPNWTSGTNTDGGVSWTWIDSADRSVYAIREDGRVLFGQGALDVSWRHKVAVNDPNGTYEFQGEATGVSKDAILKLTPTDGAAAVAVQPYFLATNGTGLRVMNSAGSTDLARFSDSKGLEVKATTSISVSNAATGATPSVTGIGSLIINNGGAQNITALSNGVDDQIVHLIFQNANTTMVSSATLLMAGSVNVTPTAWSVITMRKIPTSVSDRWVEVSRSIK